MLIMESFCKAAHICTFLRMLCDEFKDVGFSMGVIQSMPIALPSIESHFTQFSSPG